MKALISESSGGNEGEQNNTDLMKMMPFNNS